MTASRSHIFAIGLIIAVAATACAPGPPVDEASLAPKNQSTKVFADDGSLITTLRQEENRDVLSFDEIPKYLRDAVVAIEDQRFYSHKGVDLKAILRAIHSNATSGKVVEGGSTITQQLVRNALEDVGTERTLERKLREASYAYRVDQSLSKDKILELYLNTVYFGEGAYGVQTASKTYFGKDAGELTLSEAALLAGLIKAPVDYSPATDIEAAVARRDLVLDSMVRNKLITKPDSDRAKQAELEIRERQESFRYNAAYFLDYVTRLIQHSDEFAALGDSVSARANRLFRGGLRIHTTLDPDVQKAAEEAISEVLDQPEKDPSASLVAIHPSTGHVKALVGGRNFFATGSEDPCVMVGAINADGTPKRCAKVNLAIGTQGGGSGRQSGSAFKPFVLATALANGIPLGAIYPAPACTSIAKADAGGTRPWRVCNYGQGGFGEVTVQTGTEKSINTVYAQMVRDIGHGLAYAGARDVVETAALAGIESELEAVPSAALGANAVSPLEMASAFSTFVNLGIMVKPVAITKITDVRGEILWQNAPVRRPALDEAVSHLVVKTLEGVVSRGTGTKARIGRPTFGKTGTAQQWRDAWFVGGAGSDLVAAVAVFWPDGEIEMSPSCSGSSAYKIVTTSSGAPIAVPPACRKTRIRVTGGSWPAQIWQLFMLEALKGVPASSFKVPQFGVARVAIDYSRGCRPNEFTPKDLIRTHTYILGTEPTEICEEPTGPVLEGVPDVVGFPEAEATALLEARGFKVQKETELTDLLPPGVVAKQAPKAGDELEAGAFVIIWISEKPKRVTVPNVIGMTDVKAKETLEEAGLVVLVDRHEDCVLGDPGCSVTKQSPKAGERVRAGSEVSIEVRPKPP